MKKIRLHVAFICVLAGMSYCALAEEKTATPSSAAVSAEAPNNVIGVVETAKEGKADVKVAELQIIKEKASLEQEKIELIKNAEKEHSKSNGGGSAENLVIQQKLEVLEKKEAVVAAKENVVTEKIEAYERAAAIIERKLEILNSKDLSLDDIEREYERVNRLLADAKAEKAFLKGKLPLIEMETKAIEKELQTQNILLGLKGDKDNAVSDIIKTRNEHLTVTAKEGELIRERISFVDVQVELIKDYIAALNEKRIEVFRYELLTPRPLSAGMTEGAALLFFAGLLLAVMFYRPRIREAVLKSGASLAGKLMCKTLTLFLYSGIGLFAGYFIISFLGYHKLAMYVGVRVLLAVVVVAVLAVFHRVMKRVLHRGEEGDEKHTLMDGIATILGWAMVFFGVFIVTKIAGFEREAMFFLKRAAERPFFVMGEVNISAGIIFKFAFIVWLFILASRFLDAFLKSNIYKRMRLDESVQYALSVAIKYLMMVLGLFIGISALGVDLAALTVFAGTVG
ncbi:MAG: hypothetical protein KKG84_05435, partial [Candidatus Omnitrophica bacterium]|nr:hypothetical protein [Candidatus Omnitrophota bacterium]